MGLVYVLIEEPALACDIRELKNMIIINPNPEQALTLLLVLTEGAEVIGKANDPYIKRLISKIRKGLKKTKGKGV